MGEVVAMGCERIFPGVRGVEMVEEAYDAGGGVDG